MENAISSDDDKCYEKLFRDYLLDSDGFKELVLMDLPEKLRNNRICALYFVKILKTIYDECIYSSIQEMA